VLGIPGVQPLELEVRAVADLGPRMRRILLHAPVLRDFTYQPGQDVMLVLGQAGDRPLSRRYTIRQVDRQQAILELNVVAHGPNGPGARWAAAVQPGDHVNGVGPRGKIFLDPAADWHLFLGDESAAPASLVMLEGVPSGQHGEVIVEVTDARDDLPSSSAHEVRWLHRGAVPSESSTLLLKAFQGLSLPAGRGHVYIAGEVRLVAALKAAALARGLAPEQVSAKAYWGRGRANAPRGEPDEPRES
jgi:NADPH-dependent ferric siderophore reductase